MKITLQHTDHVLLATTIPSTISNECFYYRIHLSLTPQSTLGRGSVGISRRIIRLLLLLKSVLSNGIKNGLNWPVIIWIQ